MNETLSSYAKCVALAGATILAHKQFGDNRGSAWILVDWENSRGWVQHSYGSCPGCDELAARMARAEYPNVDLDAYFLRDTSWHAFEMEVERIDTQTMKIFGREMLQSRLLTQAEAEALVGKDIEWDLEVEEILLWIKAMGKLHNIN